MKTLNFALLALLAVAPVAAAQTNGSDVSGANTTGSGIAGGFFVPGNAGTASVPMNAPIAAAVASTASAVANSISSGSGLVSPMGVAIPAAAAQAVVQMMTGATPAVRAQVQAALSASGAPAALVQQLMSNLPNLLSNPTPGQVQAAISSFNGIVRTANASFLASPAPEFAAIHAVLAQISSAARAAR